MKNMKSLVLTIFTGFSMIYSQAQTIDELQSGYIRAIGGKENLAALKDIFIEVNLDVMGMQIPAKQWIVFDEASRQEVEVMGQKMITFIGKDKGWMINPLMGAAKPTPIPDAAVKAAQGTLARGSELADYGLRGLNATYQGKDTLNGKTVFKILLNRENYENTIYMDPGSYYILRSIVKTSVEDQTVEQTTDFSDYRKTSGGFAYPYAITTSNPMVGDIKLIVDTIEVNTTPDIKALESTE
ncbi:MAG: hypothetical protein M9933_07920 [Chitinophagaceae bacterium]|nr:hypothetical protein [Chitinophagaceae bacterium]